MHNWNTRSKRENRKEKLFEVIMSGDFQKLMTVTKPQVQEHTG